MPVPGGGANGGGGGRGGSFGGGGGYYGGGYYRRPFFGGFFGGLLGIILFPIIAIFLCVILLIANLYTTISVIAQGGEIVYDEAVFQKHALEQYDKYIAPNDKAYEDYLFINFLTYEDNYEYNYMGLVGRNVKSKIIKMMGNNNTELGYAIGSSVSQNYENSLDVSLVMAMDTLAEEVLYVNGNSSPYNEESGGEHKSSMLVNHTALNMDEKSVNSGLERFTEQTGLPVIILVETAESVFGKTMPVANIIFSVISLIIIIGCVVFIVLKVKRKKQMESDLKGGRIKVNRTSNYRNDDF